VGGIKFKDFNGINIIFEKINRERRKKDFASEVVIEVFVKFVSVFRGTRSKF